MSCIWKALSEQRRTSKEIDRKIESWIDEYNNINKILLLGKCLLFLVLVNYSEHTQEFWSIGL